MNQTTSPPELLIREIPLSRLVLAPENVRKTPPDKTARNELEASIRAHGLLENLVVRIEEPEKADGADTEQYAVVAGGRRLLALKALATDGTLDPDHSVPCRVVRHDDSGELSLAENLVRVAMHPADQVVAFARLAESGTPVASIAGRFGVSERIVEQRLSLGNAAPELLEAYRNGEITLDTLKAFSVTTDHERQSMIFRQLSTQGYRPSAWQVRRMLTEERVPSGSAIARYVGADDYVAAGGAVMRDLFAEEDEDGDWFEDPTLLNDLAMKKLTAVSDELSTRWKWAVPMLEVDWNTASRYGRITPQPGKPTAKEETDMKRFNARLEELSETDDDAWTDKLEAEVEKLEDRLESIDRKIDRRARFRKQDFSLAGCIATIDRDGTLKVIQGLVRAGDIPEQKADGQTNGTEKTAAMELPDAGGNNTPSIVPPAASALSTGYTDPVTKARQEAGVGIGLADDLRAIRAGIVKAHLAKNFEAAFDLVVFQAAMSVFDHHYTSDRSALDIAFRSTAERPPIRTNDEDFAAWSPAEARLGDWSALPLQWLEEDDDAARFRALRALPRQKKEMLFAAAIARTVKGQLSFEHGARPELETTVARLGIDFAKEVRPGADMLWSRLRKDHLLDIAGKTLGVGWASARSKYRKADLAEVMEKAFSGAQDSDQSTGLTTTMQAAALAWSIPGFEPLEVTSENTAQSTTDQTVESSDGHETGPQSANGNGVEAADVSGARRQEEQVPEFLQSVH